MPNSSPIAPTTPGAFKDVSSAVDELKTYARGDGLSAAELVRALPPLRPPLLMTRPKPLFRLQMFRVLTSPFRLDCLDGLASKRRTDLQRHPHASRTHQLPGAFQPTQPDKAARLKPAARVEEL